MSRPKQRRGTAATEFALALPVFLLLALGVCDFGRICHHHQILVNAARTGAEIGATRGFTDYTQASWEAQVREAVIAELSNLPDFDEAEMDYTLSMKKDADEMAIVTVDVAYPFRSVVDWPTLPHEVEMRRRIEFRQFR